MSKLGELLVREGLLSESDRKMIRRESGGHRGSMVRSVLAMGLLDENEIAALFAAKTNFRIAQKNLSTSIDPTSFGSIPPAMLKWFDVIPVKKQGSLLTVAMVDPTDKEVIEQLSFFSGLRIKPLIAPVGAIREALQAFFSELPEFSSSEFEDFFDTHGATFAAEPVEAEPEATLETSRISNAVDDTPSAAPVQVAPAPTPVAVQPQKLAVDDFSDAASQVAVDNDPVDDAVAVESMAPGVAEALAGELTEDLDDQAERIDVGGAAPSDLSNIDIDASGDLNLELDMSDLDADLDGDLGGDLGGDLSGLSADEAPDKSIALDAGVGDDLSASTPVGELSEDLAASPDESNDEALTEDLAASPDESSDEALPDDLGGDLGSNLGGELSVASDDALSNALGDEIAAPPIDELNLDGLNEEIVVAKPEENELSLDSFNLDEHSAPGLEELSSVNEDPSTADMTVETTAEPALMESSIDEPSIEEAPVDTNLAIPEISMSPSSQDATMRSDIDIGDGTSESLDSLDLGMTDDLEAHEDILASPLMEPSIDPSIEPSIEPSIDSLGEPPIESSNEPLVQSEPLLSSKANVGIATVNRAMVQLAMLMDPGKIVTRVAETADKVGMPSGAIFCIRDSKIIPGVIWSRESSGLGMIQDVPAGMNLESLKPAISKAQAAGCWIPLATAFDASASQLTSGWPSSEHPPTHFFARSVAGSSSVTICLARFYGEIDNDGLKGAMFELLKAAANKL
jgi:hypothetical protein